MASIMSGRDVETSAMACETRPPFSPSKCIRPTFTPLIELIRFVATSFMISMRVEVVAAP